MMEALSDRSLMKSMASIRRIAYYLIIFVFLFFGVVTFQRNDIWLVDVSLWYHVTTGSPGKARGHNIAGLALHKSGFYGAAIEEFGKAIVLKSEEAKLYSNRAISYVSIGEIEKGIEDFEDALRLDPEDPRFYSNLGGVYILAGRFDEAITKLNTAIKIAPGYVEAHKNLGVLYLKEGRSKEAVKEFEFVLRFVPGDRVAKDGLSRAREAAAGEQGA